MNAPRVITFGCRLNAFESEIIRRNADAAGVQDTVFLNTCAVTAEATRQARQRIRRIRRKNPDARIVVTGCAAQINPGEFDTMDEVDLVLGNQEKLAAGTYANIADQQGVRVSDIMAVRETAGHMIDGFEGRARAFVQIQNGCDHRCTFCIIPYGRGNSRSVPAGGVVEQIKTLVENGYREVVLTGVDITAWGLDLPGRPRLGGLVETILKRVPGLDRLRLTSLDPVEVDTKLLDLIGAEARLMPHLHLSLQAGDNMILKRMKRRHSREDAIRFVDAVKARRPETVFGADIIAGFPTETDGMFENSLRILDECDLTLLHVFPYSARRGTPAARMPQMPKAVRKERAKALREAGEKRLRNLCASLDGGRDEILIEQAEDGTSRGHSKGFLPVRVDGEHETGTLLPVTLSLAGGGEMLRGQPLS